jgi:hypothetical protein
MKQTLGFTIRMPSLRCFDAQLALMPFARFATGSWFGMIVGTPNKITVQREREIAASGLTPPPSST